MEKERRVTIPRMTLSEEDSRKAEVLMKRSYLTVAELLRALIRKEYNEVIKTTESK